MEKWKSISAAIHVIMSSYVLVMWYIFYVNTIKMQSILTNFAMVKIKNERHFVGKWSSNCVFSDSVCLFWPYQHCKIALVYFCVVLLLKIERMAMKESTWMYIFVASPLLLLSVICVLLLNKLLLNLAKTKPILISENGSGLC